MMQKATGTPKHVANCDVCCMFLHFKPYKDGHLHPRSTYVLDVETSESRLTSKMEEPKLADGPRIRMHGAYWQQTSWEAAALPKTSRSVLKDWRPDILIWGLKILLEPRVPDQENSLVKDPLFRAEAHRRSSFRPQIGTEAKGHTV